MRSPSKKKTQILSFVNLLKPTTKHGISQVASVYNSLHVSMERHSEANKKV